MLALRNSKFISHETHELLFDLLAELHVKVTEWAEVIVIHLCERTGISTRCHHEDMESRPVTEERSLGLLAKD